MNLLRLSALRERIRTSLWFWPAVTVTLSVVVGTFLPELEPRTAVTGFSGTPEGARAVLSTVAGSTITVTGLTFSLTVVALQMASTQFTPRLLGTFLRDSGNQAVLSVFLSTFTYSLAVLRSVRSESDAGGAFVPDISIALGLGLTLVSVAMLVYFFHHLTQQLRVESVLSEVQRDTLALVRRHLPLRPEVSDDDDADTGEEPPGLPDVPERAVSLRARRAGYLQAVDIGRLGRVAEDAGVVIRLRPTVGTHITVGSTLAWAWRRADAEQSDEGLDAEELARQVHHGVQFGSERTLQQDVAFGVRQLVDIAARALSPGINDPTTAVAALGALATVLSELGRRRMAALVEVDDEGHTLSAVPQPSFTEVLALACDQPRRYGRSEPAVLVELLRVLTDLAESALDDPSRRAVRAQVDLTVETAEAADLADPELARVQTFARHAWAALERGSRVAEVPREADGPAD